MNHTLSTVEKLHKELSQESLLNMGEERKLALQAYFSNGGVVRLANGGAAPKLLYPTTARLDQVMGEKRELVRKYSEKKNSWGKRLRDAELFHYTAQVKKLSSPTYWKHLAKYATDASYRTESDKVKLPVHLVSEPRWKPMIEMFVSNPEYRKQLAETVEHSIAYSQERRVARFASQLQDFRKEECGKKIADLGKKISFVQEELKVLEVLKKWAQE